MKWVQLYSSLNILWHCPSLGLEWKLTFSGPVATAEFSKFADIIDCSILTASYFGIWNSSDEIPSPPLALFLVLLPAAAAKSLQSCPTLCDPMVGSPPDSSVPGILQARTLEWGNCHFLLQCMKVKMKVKSLRRVWLLATPWTAAYSSTHGIFQARVLEWVAIGFSW